MPRAQEMGKHLGLSGQEEDAGGHGCALKPAAWRGASSDPITAEGSGAVTAPAHMARCPRSPEGSGEKWEALCHDGCKLGRGGTRVERQPGTHILAFRSQDTKSLRGKTPGSGRLLCGGLAEPERRRDASRTS